MYSFFLLATLYSLHGSFSGGSAGKESACNVGDLGSIPGLGRSPGGGNGNPLQYSCLESPHGQRSLAGYSPWGLKESDTTEWLRTSTCSLRDLSSLTRDWTPAVAVKVPNPNHETTRRSPIMHLETKFCLVTVSVREDGQQFWLQGHQCSPFLWDPLSDNEAPCGPGGHRREQSPTIFWLLVWTVTKHSGLCGLWLYSCPQDLQGIGSRTPQIP